MNLVHVELKVANDFVKQHHRHHKPVIGHRFSIGCWANNKLCGVAIVGRPVARAINHNTTLEVVRLCTDGTKNACSFLYAASAKAGIFLGYSRIGTYILAAEPGTTLVASAWTKGHVVRGRDWNTPARAGRRIDQPMCDKIYWYRDLK